MNTLPPPPLASPTLSTPGSARTLFLGIGRAGGGRGPGCGADLRAPHPPGTAPAESGPACSPSWERPSPSRGRGVPSPGVSEADEFSPQTNFRGTRRKGGALTGRPRVAAGAGAPAPAGAPARGPSGILVSQPRRGPQPPPGPHVRGPAADFPQRPGDVQLPPAGDGELGPRGPAGGHQRQLSAAVQVRAVRLPPRRPLLLRLHEVLTRRPAPLRRPHPDLSDRSGCRLAERTQKDPPAFFSDPGAERARAGLRMVVLTAPAGVSKIKLRTKFQSDSRKDSL
ncbi:uncharacterized protein LOC115280936 [Suricata suricatta]|uniref:uncharacterized protein LOC115280936 n=1 Tax=Suricata suricatta TaxID=37032 RepID=UPI0011560858|nr:uncharacterized protein LOC115280936 [Suricata suricatta]